MNFPNVLQTDVIYDLMCNISGCQNDPIWKVPYKDGEYDLFADDFRKQCQVVNEGIKNEISKCVVEGKAIIVEVGGGRPPPPPPETVPVLPIIPACLELTYHLSINLLYCTVGGRFRSALPAFQSAVWPAIATSIYICVLPPYLWGPCGPAARSDPPVISLRCPFGASCIPRVPSGPSGVSLDPPVCPPVPLVSLGSYSTW
jgi:hypothetical protein